MICESGNGLVMTDGDTCRTVGGGETYMPHKWHQVCVVCVRACSLFDVRCSPCNCKAIDRPGPAESRLLHADLGRRATTVPACPIPSRSPSARTL